MTGSKSKFSTYNNILGMVRSHLFMSRLTNISDSSHLAKISMFGSSWNFEKWQNPTTFYGDSQKALIRHYFMNSVYEIKCTFHVFRGLFMVSLEIFPLIRNTPVSCVGLLPPPNTRQQTHKAEVNKPGPVDRLSILREFIHAVNVLFSISFKFTNIR